MTDVGCGEEGGGRKEEKGFFLGREDGMEIKAYFPFKY